ncbi:hypothetical protein L914_17789, partial [Phytophthora nicotianae]
MLRHFLAVSTHTKYRAHWNQRCRFTKEMGWSRWLKPTNAARRHGYFATYCWVRGSNHHHVGNKHSTIVLKMTSVKWFQRRYRNLLITSSPRITMLLHDIKLLSRSEYLLIGRTQHFYCLKTSNTYFSGKDAKPVKYALRH